MEPDVVLPSLFQHLKSGEQYQDYSLPWDQDDPAEYRVYPDKIVDLDAIIERSRGRVLESKGLQLVLEEALRSAERSEQTMATVDIASMRAKREEERVAREKVGDHYRRMEDDQGISQDDSQPGPDAAADSEETDWTEELLTDPYVTEASMIIQDIVGQLRN